ncbi:unnamed protein product [Lactuca saligna]|uniref:Uncharacterized protein n=1 Tax=Lactuca saligna TaxID=75948 RepID=A0AA36E4N2_LACSI|nr:unnamed protein product [Lactuca saligna]
MPNRPTVKRKRDASKRSRRHAVSKAEKKFSCGIYKEKWHNKTNCTQMQWPPNTNAKKKQKIMQTQESVNMQGGREDVVMGDRVEPQNVEVMRENGSEQEVGVNKVPRQVKTTCQPKSRKKSEKFFKLKLAKRVARKGGSVGSLMELD